jgi:enoyl-[acyl-carrier protein] reductase II
MKNPLIDLFKIKVPIVQGGMVWNSGWKLASAVSNAGGLGLIGAGSMKPELLVEHIRKTKLATNQPFGVNVPIFSPYADEQIDCIIKEGVKIVFTSAGSPNKYTAVLKSHGITVVHVVSSAAFALKAANAGVDAIVAEGFEAGGHNGREETTTLCLVPAVKKVIEIPLIAAGGIATGAAMHAVMVLGADGVQMGSRFAASIEASSHIDYKNLIVEAMEGATQLRLKQLAPVRLLKGDFFDAVVRLEESGASKEDLSALLGKGRAKKGMFEGDLKEGELEIGQVASLIDSILPVNQIMANLLQEYYSSIEEITHGKYKF